MTSHTPITRTLHTCCLCRKEFYPKRSDRTKFCSRACGLAWTGIKVAIKGKYHGRIVVRTRRAKPSVGYVHLREHKCVHCGKEMDGDRRKQTCSEDCRAARNRMHRSRHSALSRGAITLTLLDPVAVLERDGWRCQICGIDTPKEKRGLHLSDSPELDHIVPLSMGGDHTRANTRCLCRKCNGTRNSTPGTL